MTIQKRLLSTQNLVLLSLLTAVEVVLSRFLSFYLTGTIKISFGYLPVVLAGMMTGPIGGALVGGMGDLVGSLLFPVGAYFPGFTVTAALSGMIYGLLLHDRQTPLRILSARVLVIALCSTILNTVWLRFFFGNAFWSLLLPRLYKNLIQLPVDVLLMMGLARVYPKFMNKQIGR